MERLNVDLADRSYPISIGSGLLSHSELFSHGIRGRRVMVVSSRRASWLPRQKWVPAPKLMWECRSR